MKNKILIISVIGFLIVSLSCLFLYSNNRGLKGLEKQLANIILSHNIEKIAIKSAIGDSGGNGEHSTFREVLLVKTKMSIGEVTKEFKNLDLKFPNHYKNRDNIPIFHITYCESSVFKSSRYFSIKFNEFKGIKDN